MKNVSKTSTCLAVSLLMAALAVAGGTTFLSGRSGSRARPRRPQPRRLRCRSRLSVVAPRETVPMGRVFRPAGGGRAGRNPLPRRRRHPGNPLSRGRAGQAGRPLDPDRSVALCGGCRARRRPGGRRQGASDPDQERFRARPAIDGFTHDLAARFRRPHQRLSRGGSQSEGGRSDAADGKTQSRLHRSARAGRGPGRQDRNHRRQSDRRGAGHAGADHAGVGQSDLCQLQCRRAGGDARPEDARRRIRRLPKSAAFRCRWAPAPPTARPTRGACS